ncbi:hypothetical protein ACHWQZ_G017835 [Mnemiopsis leidyi]
MVVLKRPSEGLEGALRENQCGFRRNRSCVDQIFSLRTIMRQCTEFNVLLYVNFIDLKSAFDCINRNSIWMAFKQYGLPENYVRVIKAFSDGTVSAVRQELDRRGSSRVSRWCDVGSGTGQVDIKGPPIFNVCLNLNVNWAAEKAEEQKTISRGLTLHVATEKVVEESVMDTDYADDMADLDGSKDGLQTFCRKKRLMLVAAVWTCGEDASGKTPRKTSAV